MSRNGNRHDTKHGRDSHHLSDFVNERHTSEVFVFAGLVTCLAGVATWLYSVNRWGTPAFVFAITVMAISWIGAIIFLATLCVIRALDKLQDRIVQKIDKRIDRASRKLDKNMGDHAEFVEQSIRNSIQKGELGAYLNLVEQRRPLHAVEP